MNFLTRLLARMRKPVIDKLAPVQPRVTPDPHAAAELERRREARDYYPENGLLLDQKVTR